MATPIAQASTDPIPLAFAVTLETLGQARIAAWAFPPHYPSDLLPAIWLFCLPGGGYRGLAYYDRQVPSHYAPHAYSMARTFAGNGIGSVVIDHLGTGSSTIDVHGELLTRPVLAAATDQALAQMRQHLEQGTLIPGLAKIPQESLWIAGVGHSMGGCLLTHMQGHYHHCDAVAILGWPNRAATVAMPGVDTPLEAMMRMSPNGYVTGERNLVHPFFYSPGVPDALIDADEQDATAIPAGMLSDYGVPFVVAKFAAQIRCPVYLGFGEVDVTSAPREEPAAYLSSSSITVFVQAGAHHCANSEPNRFALWDDLAAWCRAKAALSNKLRLNRWVQ